MAWRGLWAPLGAVGLGLAGLVLVSFAAFAPEAQALTVRFEVEDTPEAGPLDLWRYRYVLEGRSFSKGEGFSVLFDAAFFGPLADPPPVGTAWDVITLDPDPLLPDAGRYDAQALVQDPPLESLFEVAVVWRGPGEPGSQPFEVYDAAFGILERGVTTAVPEPASGLLVALGLGALGVRRMRVR